MKSTFLVLPSLILLLSISFSEAKKKKVAEKAEINKYLFDSSNVTYLDDFEKGLVVEFTKSAEDHVFNLQNDVNFAFLSQAKPERQVFQYASRGNISSDVVDVTKPLRVVIHGWRNTGDSPMVQNITDACLKQDVTIMVVDWSLLAKERYLYAQQLIYDVAKVTGDMLKYLIDENLVKLENIWLIGHSLGGHTVGLVGKRLIELKVGKVPVLFALDPAGPLFSMSHKDKRVDKDDAQFVVVLHTSTILGFDKPLGHVDFYPNYGFSQPGCGIDLLRQCAHSRAYLYFADAIQAETDNEVFWAVKCRAGFDELEGENCDADNNILTKFGESLHKEADKLEGLFYFETNDKKPWSKGNVRYENLNAGRNDSSSIEVALNIIIITIVISYFTL